MVNGQSVKPDAPTREEPKPTGNSGPTFSRFRFPIDMKKSSRGLLSTFSNQYKNPHPKKWVGAADTDPKRRQSHPVKALDLL
jgi:hypothetical protein